MSVGMRIQHAWNAFRNKDPALASNPFGYGVDDETGIRISPEDIGVSVSEPLPHRFRSYGVDKTLAISIFDKLATDVCNADIRHVRLDKNGQYSETIDDGLNDIFNLEANIDQTGREFIRDIVLTMLDGIGVAVCVPVLMGTDPYGKATLDKVKTMRVGVPIDWKSQQILVNVYNETIGQTQQIWIPKRYCAIIVNPFRQIMNEPGSTLRQITEKTAQLDRINDRASSGKVDILIQLPYALKGDKKVEEAKKRLEELHDQLEGSTYGIGYIDSTEKVIQLNRSLENTLLQQIDGLTDQLFAQMGFTKEIMNGTATESTMNNYYNRSVNPILDAICDEFDRKFLTKTARSQGQAIRYYRDPFTLTTSEQIAEIADKFTRNAILSSNEMRSVIGFNPVDDERANELRNKNLNASDAEMDDPILTDNKSESVDENQNEGGFPV